MKINEISELTAKELLAKKREIKDEMFALRLQKQNGQLERPHLITVARKNVARIETVLTRKRREETSSK